MRVLFFGTPDFAVPVLRELAGGKFNIAAVVTRPDKPRGRGMRRMEPSSVARAATELGLLTLKPENPNTPAFLQQIRAMSPDALAVAAYRFRLSNELLDSAPLGGWNVHPSLLPRWRGVAPVQRSIWAGDRETGVSIMRMASRLDAGAIANLETTLIGDTETRGELEGRLARIGARLLAGALEQAADGSIRLVAQDDSGATSAPVFSAGEREIRWERTAREIDRLVRALEPTPGSYFMLGRVRVGVRSACLAAGEGESVPGTLVAREGDCWRVACGQGQMRLCAVQPAGKERMTMHAFVNGRRLGPGSSLL